LPAAHNFLTALETDLGRAAEAVVRLLGQIRKRPSDPNLFAGLVHACRYCGLLDASVAAHERARQLDPGIATTAAHTYWMQGYYEQALDDPPGGIGYIRALALASLGRTDEAVALLRQREQAATSPMVVTYLFALRALLEGDLASSRSALDEAVAHNPDPESIFYVARTYARLGAGDRALEELARAVDGGFFCYPILLGDPWLDPLRADGEFRRIARRAETRHREAAARFVEAGGERLLGLAASRGATRSG
jgi:tetratricopeptide (TPR) repeat protein